MYPLKHNRIYIYQIGIFEACDDATNGRLVLFIVKKHCRMSQHKIFHWTT
jgi:hypothetical protein